MPDKEGVANEFDGPWKVALEVYLRPFLHLCFPVVHELIDWRHPPEFLDTELPPLAPEQAQGPLTIDKLVKVRLLAGRIEWLYIHVEVQAQRQSQFPLRMWIYSYRLRDKLGEHVLSLAVLADDDPAWRPDVYETALAGCELRFTYPTFKVVALPDPIGIFTRTGNPFALVIAAHQVALTTRRDATTRYRRRFELLQILSALGMDRPQARELCKVIHVLTRLPKDLELQFSAETASVQHMSIKELITPYEEILLEAARREAVLDALTARFGPMPTDVAARLGQITDLKQLRQLLQLAVTEPSLEQFRSRL